ncbi:unnamed protein product [Lactuca virosa]|uniref:Uncharacterized protein n=1 Tax=Lactuca virosa TaxID=75947 RepID=A0AAU9LG17_9ASTR|nr:unnamed protein product [Lactuca virosa]
MMKTKLRGFVIKEIPNVVVQEKKKQKAIGVLKQIQKVRGLNDEDTSTKAPTLLRMVETNRDSEEMEDATFDTDAGTFHISSRKDTNVESNFEEIHIPTIHRSQTMTSHLRVKPISSTYGLHTNIPNVIR